MSCVCMCACEIIFTVQANEQEFQCERTFSVWTGSATETVRLSVNTQSSERHETQTSL